MTKNQLAYWANLETARANRAKEEETARANRESEANQRYATAMTAQTAKTKLGEDNRHNVEVERQTKQNNIWNNVIKTLDLVTDLPVKASSAIGNALRGATGLVQASNLDV